VPGTESAQVRGVRHNLRMPIQRWRCPVVLRVKAVVFAAAEVAVALVFFPRWLAVPLAALLGAYGLAMAALGSSVTLDTDAGVLRMRVGPVFQRVRLANVAAVLVDRNKISIKRVKGWEFSLYAWGNGRLDRLLRMPAVAGDIGHAIAAAVARAKAHPDLDPDAAGAAPGAPGADPDIAARQERPTRLGLTLFRDRSRLGIALLAAQGVLAVGGALVVRVHWDSPALTVLGAVIALALGVGGLFSLLVALLNALWGADEDPTPAA
jgi:hypothetical protein